MNEKILDVRNLKMDLMSTRGIVHTVRGVDLTIHEGEIHGIVGESGCGKSMMVKSIMRLHDESRCLYSGNILLHGSDILTFNRKEIMDMRGKEISMIFQDPMNSLDPIMKAGKQIAEMLRKKEGLGKTEAWERAKVLMEQVGLDPVEQRMQQYPFEMSGGMLQRVMIAIAMACRPKLLIADEPTTALDVTIQKQILNLMLRIREKYNMAIIIVTHNLGVVAEICDRVSVMYAGEIVETADVKELFDHPAHPYTEALMRSRPSNGRRGQRMTTIPGEPPKLSETIGGCAFAPRCPFAEEKCKEACPRLTEAGEHHLAACFRQDRAGKTEE